MLDAMALPRFPHAVTGHSRPAEVVAPTVEARAARGDRGALEALLRQHARAVADLCQALCGAHDGRDAAQESLERIVTSIGRYDPTRGAFRAWALTVSRNVCRDRLRRRGLERAAFAMDGEEPIAHTAGNHPDPERLALA